ncbi:flagellar hook-associated protein FlgK [Pseudomonas sp. Q1-7]|uniref:flagellar hook-associated protein FlgK n=1 Tax=Pseudomonas sp. Q1-7 TaxID=3020843 RepID=UPI00230087AE|nr:flagellar hook-associated protein FlgK [Pseudomonas sp. Q1-7]
MSLLSQIAYSGLRAAQIGLSTTGQNIANVNTPGFSRLTPNLVSLGGQGGPNVGGGVEVSGIRRIANDFQNRQLWRATTEQSYYSGSQQYLTALEGLMSGEGSSISVGLDRFFAALSEASPTPGSIALRQQVLAEAGNLAQRFNGLSSNLDAQLSALQEQRQTMVNEMNGLSRNIAELNRQIVEAQSVGGDTSALRDHRESLVKDLSRYAGVRVNESADGGLTVAFDSGQPLVAGSTAAQLSVSTNAAGEQVVELAFAGTRFPLDLSGIGGSLGGIQDVEFGQLRPKMQALHEMAGQMAQMVNDILVTGFDLAGNPGQPLFTYDPTSNTRLLSLNNLKPEQLAFSDTTGESGNNKVLLQLLDVRTRTVTVNGSQVGLNDAYTGLLGQVASASRQNQADLKSATTVVEQAQAQRDSTSAVSLDEEGVNLMTYQQAYQANMKVISTANELFDAMLAAF